MEQDKEKTPPSSAGCDTHRCEKRENSAQKDEINEKRKESLFEHEGQRSITEEQEIADEEISGKVVQEKVPAVTMSAPLHKHSRMMDDDPLLVSHRRSYSKQSKPDIASSSSVPPSLETSNVILQDSRTAEKQKEQKFPFKRTKRGSLSGSSGFSSGPTALEGRDRTESEPRSYSLDSYCFSAHLFSSESISPVDPTSPYYPHYWSFNDSVEQHDAFSVQSQSKPGVDPIIGGVSVSPVAAEQSIIRKTTAADESKPQSKVSSTSRAMSAEMLTDVFKDSTPGTAVYPESMNFFKVPPKYLLQPLPSSPVHPSPAVDQSPSSDYLPSSQPSFIHEQPEKQQTADEKFSEEEVQVKPSSQSVSSLPHSSSSSSDSSICDLHDCDSRGTPLKSSTPSPPYRYLYQEQQQLLKQQQQQLQQLQQLRLQQRLRLLQLPQEQLKPFSLPFYNRKARERGVEKSNQVSASTSVHHDTSISDPVLGAPFHNYGAHRQSGNKVPQSKTITPPVSVFLHPRRVEPQSSSTAQKQKFPFKRTKQGSLSGSSGFSAGLMTLEGRDSTESELHSYSLPQPSSSAHLFSSESISPVDTTDPYYSHYWGFNDSVGRSRQHDAFTVQSQSKPGVDPIIGGVSVSPVAAEQSIIRKKNAAADESKPQSKVSSTSRAMSAEMLTDVFKDSTPGTAVYPETMDFFKVPPKYLFQPLPSSPVHPSPAVDQSPSSDYLPSSQPSFIHKQSEKQQTADEKFSEEEVQVKPSSQGVSSLPHSSSSSSDSSIYDLRDYDSWDTHCSTPSSPYRYLYQQQQQQQLESHRYEPICSRTTVRSPVEKRNQVSASTSVQSKTITPPVSVFSHPRMVEPQSSSTAEKQKEQTFPIKRTIQRSLSQRSSAAFSGNSSDSSDDILDQPPPALTETGMKNKSSPAAGDTTGVSQDNTGEMECVAGASDLQSSTSNDNDSDFSLLADAVSPWSLQPESESGGDRDVHVEMEGFVTAVNVSATNTLPTHARLLQTPDCFRSRRASSCLRRSHSVSSLSQTGSAENKLLRRTKSLPNMLLKSSVVDFTPVISDDGNDESYRFLCSSPGLYQCSVTDLVFHMDGEGEVVYRIVPWNRRLLAQHHKQPAGPLFDIKCLQQSVCQLHLPHCEIRSTGGCEFLSVAHVHDEGIEFISPHQITDSHVIINITGFSGFGNVKDEDSPPDPVRALVLLFYKPPAAPDVKSILNVLMLPRNVVLREVLRTRKKLVGDENYIETSSRCKLHPQQEYTLSTRPEDKSVLVQPKEAEFECESYDNYIPSFQVNIKKVLEQINLFLRDSNEHSIWEREVCLSSTGVKRSCVQSESTERLLEIRSSFIDGISGPVLKSLLDRLLEKTVITDCERESADAIQDKGDKARFVIDTVRKKGEAASSEMIEYLREVDPFLCEHLGLI